MDRCSLALFVFQIQSTYKTLRIISRRKIETRKKLRLVFQKIRYIVFFHNDLLQRQQNIYLPLEDDSCMKVIHKFQGKIICFIFQRSMVVFDPDESDQKYCKKKNWTHNPHQQLVDGLNFRPKIQFYLEGTGQNS